MKKRFLGALLAVALMVSMIPASVFATEVSGSKIVDETIGAEVQADETIEALALEDQQITSYKVYLPDNYDEEASYPAVYLMPYDGYSADKYVEDGIQGKLDEIMASGEAISMIVVMPQFGEGSDYRSLLDAVIADVESKYSVISDAGFRALSGVSVGGYMALEQAIISNTTAFNAFASHMGDFTSEANPYVETNGVIIDAVNALRGLSRSKNYIYIDGPNQDAATTVAGGTSDIGGKLEQRTNPYYDYGGSYYLYSTPDISKVEFAVLDGAADAEFYLNALGRSMNRFSNRFAGSVYSGGLTCTPQAVTSADASTEAVVTFAFNEGIAKFAAKAPDVKVTVTMSDPADGTVLYETSEVLTELEVGTAKEQKFTLDTANKADGVNTTITAYAEILGMTQELASLSLVAVQDTGTADDEQQVDLMGNWYFNAYKAFSEEKESPLDSVDAIVAKEYETWDVVQPCLGWWSNDFAPSLNGQGNFGGYAWYVRTFDMPEDFPKDGLILGVGKFDEANEVFINGHYVGSNGMQYEGGVPGVGGKYDYSNPWDVNNMYELDSSFLNYGGENVIAVRMCNSSGGGGWYEGPVGIYSQAAYNKAYGKPSVYAPEDVQKAVVALAEEQIAAIEAEDIDAYALTLTLDYFDSGFDMERRVAQVSEWMTNYDNIKVEDDVTGVFVYEDVYNYQAVRKITGTDADGNTVTILPSNVEADTVDENGAFEYSAYYAMTTDGAVESGNHASFFYDSYYSEAKGGEQTFRVYLPEGYFDEGNVKRYPTMFLLHGINSQSKAFALDNIDKLVADAIAAGEMRETILIIPDEPRKANGGWNTDMIVKDLLPTVDERYRTIDDERYRFIGGCSMGGGGTFQIGLLNPNEFSGVISFYGALGVQAQVEAMSKEYLDQYGIVMVCGNQDMYNFYNTQENMSRVLFSKGVDHYHYVNNGAHDSAFYVPLFISSIQKIEAKAYTTGGGAADGFTGEITFKEAEKGIAFDYVVNAPATVKGYLNTVVASDYTKETNPALQVPVEFVITQDDMVVARTTQYLAVSGEGELKGTVELAADGFDTTQKYTVKAYLSVLEDTAMIAKATANKVPTDLPFEDVEGDAWFTDSVEYVYENGLMTGMTADVFGPAETLSRAQFAVILHRMNGEPEVEYKATFPDVIDGTWYTDAVLWANEAGIIKGYEDGNFGPADLITREQMATMMFRYALADGLNVSKRADLSTFKDAESVSEFAKEAFQWAVAHKIITGKEDGAALDPQGMASRAECATIIMRFMEAFDK